MTLPNDWDGYPLYSFVDNNFVYDRDKINEILSDPQYAKSREYYWCVKERPLIPDINDLITHWLEDTDWITERDELGPIPDLSEVQKMVDLCFSDESIFLWVADERRPAWVSDS